MPCSDQFLNIKEFNKDGKTPLERDISKFKIMSKQCLSNIFIEILNLCNLREVDFQSSFHCSKPIYLYSLILGVLDHQSS